MLRGFMLIVGGAFVGLRMGIVFRDSGYKRLFRVCLPLLRKIKTMNKSINDVKFVTVLCLTLGMAPFFPEPHLWGKVRWVAGGAHGMAFMDWFDLVLHGFPYVLLLRIGILKISGRLG